MKLTIATCQFPTSGNIEENYEHITDLMKQSKEMKANVAHFPEACLSGYAGHDIENCDQIDWNLLKKLTLQILNLAHELEIWVVLGSSHPLSDDHKPHNSLYIINDQGQLIDRYDKRFCAGNKLEESGDLKHYSPGNYYCMFDINSIRCGALICHDYRYPELHREYKRRGVQVMFHSFHAGNIPAKRLQFMKDQIGKENHKFNPGKTYPEITMPSTMIASAASSHIWISCPNSSAQESCFGSFFVRADGVITGQLDPHETNFLLSTLDTEKEIYDSTRHWRERALGGILHSGSLVNDKRSKNRLTL
jgi:predicted amidohydrolase